MKQKYWVVCVGLLMALGGVGCFRQEVLTVEIAVPQMRSDACAQNVVQAISRLEADAILRAEMNVDRRVVSITYDSMRLGLKNIEHAISMAGFDANDVLARPDARAALPEECR